MAGINAHEDSIREMLTCAICMEEFRSPRSLPCLHTFCQTCLGDYLVRKHIKPCTAFACPTCRESIILPKNGVAGLRSNFLIKSMLGLLESKENLNNDDTVDDLMNHENMTTAETTSPSENTEKRARLSKKQVLLYQAKEEILRVTLNKAERHIATLKNYNSEADKTIDKIAKSKDNLISLIKERVHLLVDETKKYEADLVETIENEMNVEKEKKPFEDEIVTINEDITQLENIIEFGRDVLSSGSLETTAAVTDDVVKNVDKTIRRELNKLEWTSYELHAPEMNIGEKMANWVGSLNKITINSNGTHVIQDNKSETSCENEGEISVGSTNNVSSPGVEVSGNQAASTPITDTSPQSIHTHPRFLAETDDFLVAPAAESSKNASDPFKSSPLALAGFDDDTFGGTSPPIPPRQFEVTPSTTTENNPTRVQATHQSITLNTKENPLSKNSQLQISDSQNKAVKVPKSALKLPPAAITAAPDWSFKTGLTSLQNLVPTSDGTICAIGQTKTKEATYQSIVRFKSSGTIIFSNKLNSYDPSYSGLICVSGLNYRGRESIAVPLPEDARVRIIPIEDPDNLQAVRTLFHKYRNMLYRPFHVFKFNGKLWALGLDSFGRDSYEAKNKFDEWHPQCRVWDIETIESTDGPIKPETFLLPCATLPNCAVVDEISSSVYLCEKDTVSCVQLTGNHGSLMWKYGETAKKKQRLKQAQGLCVDRASGRIFVACHGDDRIVTLSTDGQFLQTVVSDKHGIKKPTAVILDENNHLYVGLSSGEVKVYKLSS